MTPPPRCASPSSKSAPTRLTTYSARRRRRRSPPARRAARRRRVRRRGASALRRGMLGGAAVAEDVNELKSSSHAALRGARASPPPARVQAARAPHTVLQMWLQPTAKAGVGEAEEARGRLTIVELADSDLIRVGSPEPGGAGRPAELRGHAEVSRSLEALGTALRGGGGRPAGVARREIGRGAARLAPAARRPSRSWRAFTQTRATVRRRREPAVCQGADAAAAEAEAAAGGRRRRRHRFRRFVADGPPRRPVAGTELAAKTGNGRGSGARARRGTGRPWACRGRSSRGWRRSSPPRGTSWQRIVRSMLRSYERRRSLRAAQAREEEAAAAAAASRVAELRERLHASEMERSRVEGESAHKAPRQAQNMAAEGRLAATAAALQEERAAVETERKVRSLLAQLDNAKADTRQRAATAAAAVQRAARRSGSRPWRCGASRRQTLEALKGDVDGDGGAGDVETTAGGGDGVQGGRRCGEATDRVTFEAGCSNRRRATAARHRGRVAQFSAVG